MTCPSEMPLEYNLIEFATHSMHLSEMDLRVARFQIQMGLLLASLLIVLQNSDCVASQFHKEESPIRHGLIVVLHSTK